MSETPAARGTAGFQGELGAFSHAAILKLLGDRFEPVPFARFEDVFRALEQKRIDQAVIPIENSLHGSVHENYDHLLRFPVQIIREIHLRIVHNLIAPPGLAFEDVRVVYSHPVALNQCVKFFDSNPNLEKSSFYDTAGSVKMVMEQKPLGAAAIASAVAAEIYQARILKASIEDDPRNYTRFFELVKTEEAGNRQARQDVAAWKTSLVAGTPNIPGALFRVMSAFALRDLSLTKIESRPIAGKPWEYLFYMDFLGKLEDAQVQRALEQVREFSDFYRILGCYPAAALPAG